MRLRVANLNFVATEAELREFFENYGEVAEVSINRDSTFGPPRCIAFVEMPDIPEARTAIEKLDLQRFKGRRLLVSEATPKRRY